MTVRFRVVVVVLVMAVSACGSGASPAPSGTAAAPPSETAAAAPTPTGGSTVTPGPSTTAAPIPLAEIVTADASIAGSIGTYVIDDRGSDSPWLPFETLPAVNAGARDSLTVRFTDGAEIGDESGAEIAPAADAGGGTARGAAIGPLAADGTSLAVGPLPAGRWVLMVRLFRADGRGDGLTYWAVSVK